MAVQYPKQLVGVVDGTLVPARAADGREIGAFTRRSIFSKVTGTIWAVNDTVPLGTKPAGHKITSIRLVTGTSLGSTTIDIGIAGAVNKYVDGATLTTTNVLTEIGVNAAAMADDPGEEEQIFATILTANIAAATVLSFIVETTGIN